MFILSDGMVHVVTCVEQTLTVMQGGAVRLRQVKSVFPLQVTAGTARPLRGSALKVST